MATSKNYNLRLPSSLKARNCGLLNIAFSVLPLKTEVFTGSRIIWVVKMKILMITSELESFAKTGGLADAVSALSIALANEGHDVRIVMPRYYRIDRKHLTALPGTLTIHLNHHTVYTEVYTTTIKGTNIPVYFIDHEQSFGREGLYGSPFDPDFSDNPKRFSILCNAAFQLCRKEAWFPDVMHAHDWQGALIPALLKYKESNNEFKETVSVFTIHNIGYQGIYGKDNFPLTNIDWKYFYAAGFEDWDRINFLKAGIISADAITTVSPTYAQEIQTPAFGFRLDGVLRFRADCLTGILNGIDTTVWNPKTDKFIQSNYSSTNLAKKVENKYALQRQFGLAEDAHVPVFGMITRLADQKGIGELFGPSYGSAFRVCSQIHLQLIVLGSGEKWCEDELRALASRLPNLKIYIGYNEALSHLIEAGSDFFLMPSKYEPCGLNQMYSLRYGTLPIVRRTGGLADTVENYNEKTGEGTGFVFDYLSPESIADTVGWAAYAWYNKKDHIEKMQIRGMKQDFSWKKSAQKYIQLYATTIEKKTGKKCSITGEQAKKVKRQK